MSDDHIPEGAYGSMMPIHAGSCMIGMVPMGHTIRSTRENELVICFEDGSAIRRVMTPAEKKFWHGVNAKLQAANAAQNPPNGDQGNENQGEHDGIEGA